MAGTKRDAERFAERWRGRGNEDSDTQLFWIDLLQSVLGLPDALSRLRFEVPVTTAASDHKGRIDVLIPVARVVVEQKSAGIDLSRPEPRQGRMVTPAQQALAYAQGLPLSQQPRYVVACNFQELWVYDRERDALCKGEPLWRLALADLPANLPAVQFLGGGRDAPASLQQAVSVEAGKIMARLHDEAAKGLADPDAPDAHHALSVLMTRLMFLMFCEDAGLVPANAFRDFVQHYEADDLADGLSDLFAWLDTPPEERRGHHAERWAKLPYMDGGLFSERVELPPLSETFRTTLIVDGCQEFDWSGVSPTVFGSIFEGALSHDHRRAMGQHFTSPENIHKVIDPLFLDELAAELDAARERPVAGGARRKALEALHGRLGSIVVLDPACGSGNFLTESYLSLRRLENQVLFELARDGQQSWSFEDAGEGAADADSEVFVSLASFHGIELEDFACCVARTALWIAEKQADAETAKVTRRVYQELPLTDYAGVVEGNALRLDWNDVVPAGEVSYVCGNPPFLGARNQSGEQKREVMDAFEGARNAGNVDYCAAWYAKAARYTEGTHVRCAFVSTNSICQGEQVATVWKPLADLGVHIDFAHTTFRWESEADDRAHVFCVIVGFSREQVPCRLFVHDTPDSEAHELACAHINAYLADGPDAFVWGRPHPISDVPEIGIGSQPIDDGNYLFTDEEKDAFLKREPAAERFFHPWLGSKEFLHGYHRWCLWLGEATYADLKVLPLCRERVERVRQFRLGSKRKQTLRAAETPNHFGTEIIPRADAVVVPQVSSQRRRYIPMGFIGPDVFCSDKLRLVPGANLYEFGVLQSQFHNAWMRRTTGRLKDDYQYTNSIVYNCFVWPDATEAQRERVADAAQAVLDARAAYGGCSLAELYDPDDAWMFPQLAAAHQALDAAVEAAYGVDFAGDEQAIVAHLFSLYAQATQEE